jgi:hypothetical protein
MGRFTLATTYAEYFEKLATPKALPEFDSEYQDSVNLRNLILQHAAEDADLLPAITDELITRYIAKLKKC